MADERDCSKYPVARSNLHNVREQISAYLCDIDHRISNSVDEAWATGLIDGGELNIVNAQNIQVIEGAGVIIDSYTDPRAVPIRTYLSWVTQDEIIDGLPHPPGTTIFFMIQDTGSTSGAPIENTNLGVLVQSTSQPTPAQVRDNIFLGYAVYNGDFWKEVSSPLVINNSIHTLSEYLRSVAGAFFIESGGKITESSTRSLSRDEGVYWEQNRSWHVNRKDPNRESFPEDINFQWRYINFDFGFVSALTNTADFVNYDDLSGGIAPIPGATRATTIQRLYVDTADNYWMQYGQVLHDNFIEAIASIGSDQTDTIFPDVGFGARLLGYVIAERNSTGWLQEKAEFVTATEGSIGTGAGSGVTDHDQLNKILPDDHHDKMHAHDGLDGSGSVSHSSLTDVQANQHHPQVHKLYGEDSSLVDAHEDVDSTNPLEVRHGLFWDGSIFNPEFRINWRGAWGQQEYQTYDTVIDFPWLMTALVPTTDRPAPQPNGDPAWTVVEDPPFWQTYEYDGVVYSGHKYTFNELGYFRALRIWVPELSSTTNYRVVIIRNPNSDNATASAIEEPVLKYNDWTVLGLTTELVVPGEELVIYIDALNSADEVTWAYNWFYRGTSNTEPPLDGGWNTNIQNTLLRIDYFDAETPPVDHSTELDVVVGTVFEISEIGTPTNFRKYIVDAAPVNLATYYEYTVTQVDSGGTIPAGAATQIRAVQPIPNPTKFVGIPLYWNAGNQPVWGAVESFLEFDDVPQAVDPNNLYGIDIAFQRLTVSPDWDFMALSSGSGGGGSGGGAFPEPPDDGTTYGRITGDWEPVYTQQESNLLFQSGYDWIVEQNDRDVVWGDNIRFDTPPNYCQLPIPDQDVSGASKLNDILIWNDGNIPDQNIELRPAPGTYFTFNGVDKPIDEVINVKTGEVVRIQTRATGVSYGIAIEAAARFDGADSFGFVANNDGMQTGRYLSDAGTWQALTVIPAGGIRFEFSFTTDITVSDPTAGYVKLNNADPNLADTLSFSELTQNGNSIRVWGSQLRQGDYVGIVDQTNGISYYYEVSGAVINHTTWYEVPVTTYFIQPGLIPDQQLLSLALIGNPKSRLPIGGDENWVLAKASDVDFDVEWQNLDVKFSLDNVPQDGWTYGRYWDGDSLEWNTGVVNPVAFGGWVSIGTQTPKQPLHVVGRAGATGRTVTDTSFTMSLDNAGNNAVLFVMDETINSWAGILFDAQSTQRGIYHYSASKEYRPLALEYQGNGHYFVNSGYADVLSIRDSGNVGIGTSNPLDLLHIHSPLSNAYTKYTSGGAATGLDVGVTGAGDGIVYHRDAKPLRFGTFGAERMRITDAGNVGIGTETPTNLAGQTSLTINGTNVSRVDFEKGGVYQGNISTFTGAGLFYNTAVGLPHWFSVDSTLKMVIASNGNVGIGTDSPNATAEVRSVGNFNPVDTATNRTLRIACSGATTGINTYGASIEFGQVETNAQSRAAIVAKQMASSTRRMGLSFWTHPSNLANQTMVEQMVIGHNGGLLMNPAVTGGDKGLGTINVSGDYYKNGQQLIREGTWTPLLINGAPTTSTSDPSTYTRIGNRVWINGYVKRGSGGTNANQVQVGQLPFSVSNAAVALGDGNVGSFSKLDFGGAQNSDGYFESGHLGCYVSSASQAVVFTHSVSESSTNYGGNVETVKYGSWLSSGYIRFSASYTTDDP